jgi:hypothetical protein
MRYCIPFLDVRDRSPILTVCMTFLWTEKLENGLGRWEVWIILYKINSLKHSRIERYTVGIWSNSYVFETWTWFCIRFRPFILYSMNASDLLPYLIVPKLLKAHKRFQMISNGRKPIMELSAFIERSNKRSGTLRNVRAGAQKRFGTNSGKRSRFKNERIIVSLYLNHRIKLNSWSNWQSRRRKPAGQKTCWLNTAKKGS